MLWTASADAAVPPAYPTLETQAGSCLDADSASGAGKQTDALATLTRCHEKAPDDVALWRRLAEAETRSGAHGRAELWVMRALERYPEDLDWRVLQVRLRARSGRLEEAWILCQQLPRNALDDPETLHLAGDLARWTRRDAAALRHYDTYLELRTHNGVVTGSRGLVHQRLGNLTSARQDFQHSCAASTPHPEACERARTLARDELRIEVFVQPRYTLMSDRHDMYGIKSAVRWMAHPRLWGGLGFEQRVRDYGGEPVFDSLVGAQVGFRLASALVAQLRGTAGIMPNYSALADMRSALSFGGGAWRGELAYWWLEFRDARVHVVVPSTHIYWGPLMFDLRYYLGLHKGPQVRHSGLARVVVFVGNWHLYGGGGGGNQTDFLWSSTDMLGAHFAVQAVSGAAWEGTPTWRLGLDYVLRVEVAQDQRLVQNQLLLGVTRRF